jgi:hypothetical protein
VCVSRGTHDAGEWETGVAGGRRLPRSLIRIPSHQLGKNVPIGAFERELNLRSFAMADFTQQGEELLLALHHFRKASSPRCGKRSYGQRVTILTMQPVEPLSRPSDPNWIKRAVLPISLEKPHFVPARLIMLASAALTAKRDTTRKATNA